MKKLLILPIVCLFFTSCSNVNASKESNVSKESSASPIDNEQVLVDSAKSLIVQANEIVKKGIIGEMPNSKVNELIRPLMENFNSVYKLLKPEDTIIVRQFRIDKINEIIDLQIEQQKK